MDQELIQELQEKYAESQELEEKLNLIMQQVSELEEFGKSLKDLDENKENEILAGLGKGVFISAEIKNKELFVGVGSGIFVKKKPSEAREVIKGQVLGLMKMREDLSLKIENINQGLQELMQNLEKEKGKK